MANKTYGQLCPLARSLDVLGERWTLLIIRELLLGPRRFKDILAALPAMGANRLSERLVSLATDGIINKSTAPMPIYELTEYGELLRAPLITLSLWGLKLPIDERIDASTARAELVALGLASAIRPRADGEIHQIYEFHVGDEKLHFLVENGRVLPRSGSAPAAADLLVTCDLCTFTALALREITPEQALQAHRVLILAGTAAQFIDALMGGDMSAGV
jgi:DNA-binding HxlR family transcriptional regulator